MAKKPASSKKLLNKDFITGLLLGFLITFLFLFIVKPMLMPDPAVAPTGDYQGYRYDR